MRGDILPEKSIGLEVRMLSNLIRRDVEKHASIHKFGPENGVRGWAIDFFYKNKDRDIFQKDFEEKFQIRRSTASNILKLMEKNGYITRESVASDARLKKIVFTEKAEEIQSRVVANHKKALERLQGPLSDREVANFMKLCSGFAERAAGI